MTDHVQEDEVGSVTHLPAVREIQGGNALVRPADDLATIEKAFRDYQDLKDKLLIESDYQGIGNKKFTKRSGWRKLGVAVGVSQELVKETHERDERGRITRTESIVRAIAPNGRATDGVGACDFHERCCDPAFCSNRSSYHNHCAPGCPGFNHFSMPQHDIPATAYTRAASRAESDLFGFGEVSAEEMGNQPAAEVAAEQGWWRGWDSQEQMRMQSKPVTDFYKALPDSFKEPLRDLLKSRGYDKFPLGRQDLYEFAAACLLAYSLAQRSQDTTTAERPEAGDAAETTAERPEAPAAAQDGPIGPDAPTAAQTATEGLPTPEEVGAMDDDVLTATLERLGLPSGGNVKARRARLLARLMEHHTEAQRARDAAEAEANGEEQI